MNPDHDIQQQILRHQERIRSVSEQVHALASTESWFFGSEDHLWYAVSTAEAEAAIRELRARRAVRVELVDITEIIRSELARDPSLIHHLSPHQFEGFVFERLFAMGFEPRRVGSTNHKDGGIDIVFWPRRRGAFPFLGAAQVRHHRDPERKEGPQAVREFSGVIAAHPFNVGMFVTNTSFTPDAHWFASRAHLVRLRDFEDIKRWLENRFSDAEEWREIPSTVELCPGVTVEIGRLSEFNEYHRIAG